MKNEIEDDKPIDWVILLGSIAFIAGGILAPWIIIEFGGANPREWGWHSWQTYLSIVCSVVYFAVGKVMLDMRKDDEVE